MRLESLTTKQKPIYLFDMTTTQRSLMNSEMYDGMDSVTRYIYTELKMQEFARRVLNKVRTEPTPKEQNALSIKCITRQILKPKNNGIK